MRGDTLVLRDSESSEGDGLLLAMRDPSKQVVRRSINIEDMTVRVKLRTLKHHLMNEDLEVLKDKKLKELTASREESMHTYVEITEELHEESGMKFQAEQEVIVETQDGVTTKRPLGDGERQRWLEREVDEILEHIADRVRKYLGGDEDSMHTRNAEQRMSRLHDVDNSASFLRRAPKSYNCRCVEKANVKFHECLEQVTWTKDFVMALSASERKWASLHKEKNDGVKQPAQQRLESQERRSAEAGLTQIVVGLLDQIFKAENFFNQKQNEVVNEFVRLQVQTLDRFRRNGLREEEEKMADSVTSSIKSEDGLTRQGSTGSLQMNLKKNQMTYVHPVTKE